MYLNAVEAMTGGWLRIPTRFAYGIWLGRLILCVLALHARSADAETLVPASPYADFFNGEPDAYDLHNASKIVVRQGCGTLACRTIKSVEDAVDALDARNTPNSLARIGPPPKDPDGIARRAVQRSLLSHPNEFGFACDILVKQITHTTAERSIYTVGLNVELAMRMDGPRKNVCTRRAMAAIPPGRVFDQYIGDYLTKTCREQKLGRCERLRRP